MIHIDRPDLPKIVKDRARQLRKLGWGAKRIGSELGLSCYTVRDWIDRWSFEDDGSNPEKSAGGAGSVSVSANQKAVLEKLSMSAVLVHSGRLSWHEIEDQLWEAKQSGISNRTLRHRFGIPAYVLRRTFPTEAGSEEQSVALERLKLVQKRFGEGASLSDIENECGVSHECAKSWRRSWRTGRLEERIQEEEKAEKESRLMETALVCGL